MGKRLINYFRVNKGTLVDYASSIIFLLLGIGYDLDEGILRRWSVELVVALFRVVVVSFAPFNYGVIKKAVTRTVFKLCAVIIPFQTAVRSLNFRHTVFRDVKRVCNFWIALLVLPQI